MSIDQSVKLYKDACAPGSDIAAGCTIGDNSKVEDSRLEDLVRIDRNNYINSSIIGRHSYTGSNTKIIHAAVGRFVSISWNVTIGGGEHDYSRLTTHSFLYDNYSRLRPEGIEPVYDRFAKPCTVGNDVWIGAGAIITRGVTVGNGAVIAAGAVVTHDVPDYAIVAGCPAKVIKYRFPPEKIKSLLEMKWWDWSDAEITERFDMFAQSGDES